MSKVSNIVKKCAVPLFVIYLGFLILVIVLKYPTGLVSNALKDWMNGGEIVRFSPQLIPFKTIIEYTKNVHSLTDWFIKNLAANVIMFFPYGFLLPMIGEAKSGVKVIVSGTLLSLVIEIFQYITALGLCDVDDLILNATGVALGYGFYKLIEMFAKKSNEK